MNHWLKVFKQLPRPKKIMVGSALALFCLVIGFAGFWLSEAQNQRSLQRVLNPTGTLITGKVEEAKDFPNPLNGIFYKKSEAAAWKDRLPLAVVIENHIDARPQSGMSQAEITYEVLAEGGITRTINVFLAGDSDLGPVRSNRTYFLDWVSEYGAGYAHIGGSPEAQGLVKTYAIKDLDQFGLGTAAYERTPSRLAPHNVYTTTAKLRSAAESKYGYKGPVAIDMWAFKNKEATAGARPAQFTLQVNFGANYSLGNYGVEWRYDPKENIYLRWNGGKVHSDAVTNQQLTAKNVVVQYLITQPDPSGHSRLKMQTTGSGQTKVFTDGKVISGTWKKNSRTSRTRFFDENGKEIPLNRGKVWIEIVPVGSSVTY